MRTIFTEIKHQLRWALPMWFVRLISNWWPNNRVTIKIRGFLFRPFIGKCGKNFQVASGVTLLNAHKLVVGDDVYFSYDAWLNALGDLTIEDQVIVGPRVSISTLTHLYKDNSFRFGKASSGPVKIGKGTWLAANASVKYGVTVGKGCLIGANSVVIKDVEDNKFVSGVPAKVIADCVEKDLDTINFIHSRSSSESQKKIKK